MTNTHDRDPRKAPPPPPNLRRYGLWVGLGIAILLALLLLSRCGREDRAEPVAATPAPEASAAPGVAPATAVGPEGLSTLEAYLQGTDAAPRTFVFERVHFTTASKDIRAEDREEITAVADVLKRYPNTRVRLLGYADARGSDPANRTLAQARADTVRAALTAAGVDARRIEALSGGEANPVTDNASASGMAENRRTELVVVQR